MTRETRARHEWPAVIYQRQQGSMRLETEGEGMTVEIPAVALEDSGEREGWKKAYMDMNGVDLEDLAEFIGSLVEFFNSRIDDLNETVEDIPELKTAHEANV